MIRRILCNGARSSSRQILSRSESTHQHQRLLQATTNTSRRNCLLVAATTHPLLTSLQNIGHNDLTFQSKRKFSSTSHLSPEDADRIPNSNENFIEYEQDFFGEPISFLGEPTQGQPQSQGQETDPSSTTSTSEIDSKTKSILAFDTHLVQMLSKGQAYTDGGDEFGMHTKAAHSSAITWADLIRHVSSWCRTENGDGTKLICDAPMLAVAAFSPFLISGGAAYLINLDRNYFNFKPQNSCCAMVQAAIDCRADERLSRRESLHLWALHYLFQNEPAKALAVYGKLLESCPGDALGLSLALDVAEVLGDKDTAFRLASSVASYWNERGQRSPTGQTAMAGHSIGTSLIATGFAIGGRIREAEQLAEKSLSRDASASGVAAAALGNVYYAEGRASEGASTFTGHGVEYYESCGFMFFDSHMGALGSRFIMDRSGASADRVAVRLYDEHFGRIFEYSGYDDCQEGPIVRKVPSTQKRRLMDSASGAASSMFGKLFGGGESKSKEQNEKQIENEDEDDMLDSVIEASQPRSLEDVLTWLPPTKNVMVGATLLLFRLTVSGAVHSSDARWENLRTAWEKINDTDNKISNAQEMEEAGLCHAKHFHYPSTAQVGSSLVGVEPSSVMNSTDTVSHRIRTAASLMGSLMQIQGNKTNYETEQDAKKKWAKVVQLLYEARTGWGFENEPQDSNSPFQHEQPTIALNRDLVGFDISLGSFMEHAICHAAVKSEDHESLCIARSLCSESVALRSNSPENWYRYGVVLEKLGDEENAADAFHASVSLGSGEGGQLGGTR